MPALTYSQQICRGRDYLRVYALKTRLVANDESPFRRRYGAGGVRELTTNENSAVRNRTFCATDCTVGGLPTGGRVPRAEGAT